MQRSIVGFDQNEVGDWVAELACLHGQHVRHEPPFRLAPWVVDPAGRSARIGQALNCPPCDRAELPDGLRVVRTTQVWDERSIPEGLRRAHRIAPGVWGRLWVKEGALRFHATDAPALEDIVRPGRPQAIPPDVEHNVEPVEKVRFFIEFLRR